MAKIWMVSAYFGNYTNTWVEGGYAVVGWLGGEDLTSVHSREEILQRFREAHPDQTPNQSGTNGGQLAAFILKVQPGDYVMTRCAPPTRKYRYGIVEDAPLYYAPNDPDGCPFPHRRKIKWNEQALFKEQFSIPFKKNLSAAKTLFEVRYLDEFLAAIKNPSTPEPHKSSDSKTTKRAKTPQVRQYKEVVGQILNKISPSEFEDLTVALMEAMGYEDVERTGGTGDEGVDVKGMLQSEFVNINMYVQVKHYTNKKVPKSDVKKLHGVIPFDGRSQGAIITTSGFSKGAVEAADGSSNFAYVTLIDGHRLVELLMEHWNADSLAVSPDPDAGVYSWHERLGLTQGLMTL